MSTLGNAATGVRCDLERNSLRTAPGDYHLVLAGCDDCNARWVASMSLELVEQWYRSGHVRQALYEAYMHVWSTGAVRYSSIGDGWEAPPTDPEVTALVALIRGALHA